MSIPLKGMSQFRFRDGQITENTTYYDPTPLQIDAITAQQSAVNAFYSVYNTKEYDMLDAVLAPDFRHGSVDNPLAEGLVAFKAFLNRLHTNFEPIHLENGEIFLAGDMGAAQWTLTVTSPATGMSIPVKGLSLLRFQDGRIMEQMAYYNPTPLQTDATAALKTTVNAFYSVWNTKDYDSLDSILAPGFRNASLEGIDAFKAYMSGQVHAFQDVHLDVHQSVVEGESGAAQWTLLLTDPATGRRITLPGMSLLRFQNGQILEHKPYYNPAPLQED